MRVQQGMAPRRRSPGRMGRAEEGGLALRKESSSRSLLLGLPGLDTWLMGWGYAQHEEAFGAWHGEGWELAGAREARWLSVGLARGGYCLLGG